MTLKELMQAFAAEAGIECIEPDETGLYHIDADDMTISLGEVSNGIAITLATIGEVPPEGAEQFYRMLLEGMFCLKKTKGATFAIDGTNNKVVLRRVDSVENTNLETFKKRISDFADVLVAWRSRISDFRLDESLDVAKRDGDELSGLATEGFLRV